MKALYLLFVFIFLLTSVANAYVIDDPYTSPDLSWADWIYFADGTLIDSNDTLDSIYLWFSFSDNRAGKVTMAFVLNTIDSDTKHSYYLYPEIQVYSRPEIKISKTLIEPTMATVELFCLYGFPYGIVRHIGESSEEEIKGTLHIVVWKFEYIIEKPPVAFVVGTEWRRILTADVNGDGVVTGADYDLAVRHFGAICNEEWGVKEGQFNPWTDLNSDCMIDFGDIELITGELNEEGRAPPAPGPIIT